MAVKLRLCPPHPSDFRLLGLLREAPEHPSLVVPGASVPHATHLFARTPALPHGPLVRARKQASRQELTPAQPEAAMMKLRQ